jgi:hypothetical protein
MALLQILHEWQDSTYCEYINCHWIAPTTMICRGWKKAESIKTIGRHLKRLIQVIWSYISYQNNAKHVFLEVYSNICLS